MELIEAIILGIVQGIGEFLPISSSGHLVIASELLGIESTEGSMMFNILLHFGTLIAVFIAFFSDIKALVIEGIKWIFDGFKIRNIPERKFILLVIVSTLPLFVVLPFKSYIEGFFESTLTVGIALIYTSILLFVSDKIIKGKKEIKETTYKNALFIGIMQAIAVVPGISRAGSTITAGLFSGLSREYAVRYSFIMSIPVILGANILEIFDMVSTKTPLGMPIYVCFAGVLAAMISGIFAIKLVKYIVKNDKFSIFAYYTLILGLVVIIANIIR